MFTAFLKQHPRKRIGHFTELVRQQNCFLKRNTRMSRDMANDMKPETLDLNIGPATDKLCTSFLSLLLNRLSQMQWLKQYNTFILPFWNSEVQMDLTGPKIRCWHSCVPFRGSKGESGFQRPPSFFSPFLHCQSQQVLLRLASLCSPSFASHFYFLGPL